MASDPYPDDVETVSYHHYLPRAEWERWVGGVSVPIYERLRTLIEADAASPTPARANVPARVIACEPDTFQTWLETIPRSEHIADRFDDLLQRDIRAHRQADQDLEDATARVIGQRLSIRATQARGALRDGEDDPADIEAALEIMDDVVKLAESLQQ